MIDCLKKSQPVAVQTSNKNLLTMEVPNMFGTLAKFRVNVYAILKNVLFNCREYFYISCYDDDNDDNEYCNKNENIIPVMYNYCFHQTNEDYPTDFSQNNVSKFSL